MTLLRLGQMCSALEQRRALGVELAPNRLLTALRNDLERHFETEESEAHFGVVVRERPSLTRNIHHLKAEHRLMLHWIDQLLTLAQDERQWRELQAPTLRLIELLRQHERAEAHLLQEFSHPDGFSTSTYRP